MSFPRHPSLSPPRIAGVLVGLLCLLFSTAYGQGDVELLRVFPDSTDQNHLPKNPQFHSNLVGTNGVIAVNPGPGGPIATEGQFASLDSSAAGGFSSSANDGVTTVVSLSNIVDTAWVIDPATVVNAVNAGGGNITYSGVNFVQADDPGSLVELRGLNGAAAPSFDCTTPRAPAQTFSQTGLNLPISNTEPPGQSSITVPANAFPAGLDIQGLRVTLNFSTAHPYMRDLDIRLNGKQLFRSNCGRWPFRSATFNLDAAELKRCFTNDAGETKPVDPASLSQFLGLSPNGRTFNLKISDLAGGDDGVFDAWSVEVLTDNSPMAPLENLAAPLVATTGPMTVSLATQPGDYYMAELLFWAGSCLGDRRTDIFFDGTNEADRIASEVQSPLSPAGPIVIQHRFCATGTNSTFRLNPVGPFPSPVLSAVVLHTFPEGCPVPPTNVVQLVGSFGSVFSQGLPDLLFGDPIEAPSTRLDGGAIAGNRYNYWRAEPVRPGEPVVISTNNLAGDVLVTNAVESFYYSPHADRVYASTEGTVEIVWQTAGPLVAGGQTFGVITQSYQVAASSRFPERDRTIFWTEGDFTGPDVLLPTAIQDLVIVYNPRFQPEVPSDEVVDPDQFTQGVQSNRTLWFESQSRVLKAYNKEGRVLIEYLGAARSAAGSTTIRESIGVEVVDIIREAFPEPVTTWLGEQLLPSGVDVEDPLACPCFEDQLGLVPYEVRNNAIDAVKYTEEHFKNGEKVFYAVHENADPSQVQFYWQQRGFVVPEMLWPKQLNIYELIWPDREDFDAQFVRPGAAADSTNSFIALPRPNSPELVRSGPEVSLDFQSHLHINLGAGNTSPSLVRFRAGNDFWYIRIIAAPEETFFEKSQDAFVGNRIPNPPGTDSVAGYIDPAYGTAYNVGAYIDPYAGGGVTAAERGAIIPVNALPNNDQLRVWWFKKIDPPADVAGSFQPVFVASTVQGYTLKYPPAGSVRPIVLASNKGSGGLSPAEALGSIYVQNDPVRHGYNPNEEHAIMRAGAAWALRDDLNLVNSSRPYVLVDYTDPDPDGTDPEGTDPNNDRPGMAVFEVLRETAEFPFRYDAVAGTLLQAPMPLPIMPAPLVPLPNGDDQSRNYEEITGVTDVPANPDAPAHYRSFTYEDRKGSKWIYRGPHDSEATNGVTPTITMHYYYRTEQSFAFPDPADTSVKAISMPPELGSIVPYLRRPAAGGGWIGDRLTDAEPSLPIVFTPKWPEVVPELRFAETLGLPKFGLPQIRGQRSVQVIYEGSLTTTNNPRQSVVLHDPTRAKTFSLGLDATSLDEIPASIATAESGQKVYFQNLPTHLQDRLFFDPLAGPSGQLVLEGAYQEEIVGESYFLLNVLDATELEAAKDLCADDDERKARWDSAIDGLSTKVERFIENPNVAGTYYVDPRNVHRTFGVDEIVELTSPPARPDVNNNAPTLDFFDEAVDSFALTAVGGGSGYVSIIVGNGLAFTPGEEPVSVHILRVGGGLYQGQLKPVVSSNPLSENVTVQHTGDFAAKTPAFEFEWRKAPPLEGKIPKVYDLAASTVDLPPSFDIVTNGVAAGTETIPFRPDIPRVINATNKNGVISLSGTIGSLASNATDLAVFYVGVIHAAEDKVEFRVNGQTAFTTGDDLPVSSGDLPASPGNNVRLAMNGVTAVYRVPTRLLSFAGTENIDIRMTSVADIGSRANLDIRLVKVSQVDRTGVNYGPIGNGQAVPGKNRHLVAGAGIDTLADNFYIMRYRPLDGHALYTGPNTPWSVWTEPAFVPGWIKRVLAGINPFNQRISDFFENAVDTDVSLITQAGTRYEGDIALNLDAVQDAGLIEIYETVLKRGINLSIGGTPEIDYAGANDALLLAAGYLADLYMALGNEAYADAANPGILYDSQAIGTIADDAVAVDFDDVFRNTATARFAFQGQVSSLLEEELHLLRGRDVWNYTRGIDAGEVIYALNYNITEKDDDSADGKIDAADAARQYPQGHGDAYGHYLTALSYYYRLLTDDQFTWGTRSEFVNILGVPVSVDYLDERKFAAAAAALGRTTTQLQTLEHRKSFQSAGAAGWEHLTTNKQSSDPTKRVHAWSFDDWSHRAGQGTLFHWVTANAILPEVDNVNEGIQKIDRTTVPELDELAKSGEAIQLRMDSANSGLNPLDLTADSVVFDISPQEVAAGKSHFEQVFERAVQALQNAGEVFDRATDSSRLLRAIENQNQNLNASVVDQERAFLLELWDIYGSPYQGDLGPGKAYPQGYGGPDIYRYMYIDRPFEMFSRDSLFIAEGSSKTYTLLRGSDDFLNRLGTPANFAGLRNDAANTDSNFVTTVTWNTGQGPYLFSSPDMGKRPYLGTLQHAAADVRLAEEELMNSLRSMNWSRDVFLRQLDTFERDMGNRAAKLTANQALTTAKKLSKGIKAVKKAVQDASKVAAEKAVLTAYGVVEGFPKVNGAANDVTSAGRAAAITTLLGAVSTFDTTDFAAKRAEAVAEATFFTAELALDASNLGLDEEKHWREQTESLRSKYFAAKGGFRDVDVKHLEYIRALERFRVEENNGNTAQARRRHRARLPHPRCRLPLVPDGVAGAIPDATRLGCQVHLPRRPGLRLRNWIAEFG